MLIKKILHRLKLLVSDWRWWPFFFQRIFVNPVFRNNVSNLIASWVKPTSPHICTVEADIAAVKDLNTPGITHLGQVLAPEKCAELRAYFEKKLVYDPYREQLPHFLPLDESARFEKTHIAHHQPEDVLAAPEVLDIANDERVLKIVSGFLGCKPLISYIAVWWSYHVPSGAQEAEFFHRDVDDWRFVKLFVYLDDVSTENGPHVYVKHSSRTNKLTSIRRFTDDEVEETFGAHNIILLPANAGVAFLEDTYGIHKGQPVGQGRRLILQVVYGMTTLPYSPKSHVSPVSSLNTRKFDPWINRVYFR